MAIIPVINSWKLKGVTAWFVNQIMRLLGEKKENWHLHQFLQETKLLGQSQPVCFEGDREGGRGREKQTERQRKNQNIS